MDEEMKALACPMEIAIRKWQETHNDDGTEKV
jgi:hypothetical protein